MIKKISIISFVLLFFALGAALWAANEYPFPFGIKIARDGVTITGTNGTMTILGIGDGQDEDIKLDLNTTANTVEITSPTSSLDTFDFNTLNIDTTGGISGRPDVTSISTNTTLTAKQLSGETIVATATGIDVELPDVCDSATGAHVVIFSRDAGETISIAVADSSDTINYRGLALDADDELDSPGAAWDFIYLKCQEENEWYTLGNTPGWTDGGPAD